jgi:hypothetical protein
MFPDIRYRIFQNDVGVSLSDGSRFGLAFATWTSVLGGNDGVGRARFGSLVDR